FGGIPQDASSNSDESPGPMPSEVSTMQCRSSVSGTSVHRRGSFHYRPQALAALALRLFLAVGGQALAVGGGWTTLGIGGTAPPPRSGNSLTEAWSQVLLLFGGTTSSGGLLDDTWVLYIQPACPGISSYWTQIP